MVENWDEQNITCTWNTRIWHNCGYVRNRIHVSESVWSRYGNSSCSTVTVNSPASACEKVQAEFEKTDGIKRETVWSAKDEKADFYWPIFDITDISIANWTGSMVTVRFALPRPPWRLLINFRKSGRLHPSKTNRPLTSILLCQV